MESCIETKEDRRCRPRSAETKAKISLTLTNRQNRKHTDEQRAKISEGIKRKWLDESYRDKTIKSRKNRRLSEETKKKISDSMKGRKQTEEHVRNAISGRSDSWDNGYRSSIELDVKDGLDLLGIDYQFQRPVCRGRFIVDFYLPDYRLVIECNGNYWHNYPNGTERDVRLQSYVEQKGRTILWLWEHEIKDGSFDIAERIKEATTFEQIKDYGKM